MTQKILFLDRDLPLTRPYNRLFSIFSSRNGIFSPLERTRRTHPGAALYLYHPNAAYEALMSECEGLLSYRAEFDVERVTDYLSGQTSDLEALFDDIQLSDNCDPIEVLKTLPARLEADRQLAIAEKKLEPLSTLPEGCWLRGNLQDLYCGPGVDIQPGTFFDTTAGPILIDANASVGQFSYLQGPLYLGEDSKIDNARLLGGMVVGQNCRLGGELEASLINDFSNKHHEGFVGHSLVGRWVNLGALTTTSDLKNNYGQVRLLAPASFHPATADSVDLKIHDSGEIKLGSLIGDCVKTAIGTLLNTGTVLDSGSCIFGGNPPKYLPPFTWGLKGARYQPERFAADCQTIFARREQHPPARLAELLALYS
ncbi:hypothetical protein ACTL6U_00170 [Rhodovibrionaceae bacterium A322]